MDKMFGNRQERRKGGSRRRNKSEKGRGGQQAEKVPSFEGLRELDRLSEETVEYLRSLGIPTVDNRLDMMWYIEAGYSEEEIEKDLKTVKELQEKFEASDAQKTKLEKGRDEISERLEEIVPVVVNFISYGKKGKEKKTLAKDFIAVRSTLYSDFNDGTDTFLVHVPSGRIICCIDETNSGFTNVVLGSGPESKKPSKYQKVIEKNTVNKDIKYGLRQGEDGQFNPCVLKKEDTPLVYLSMSRDEVVDFINGIPTTYDIDGLCNDFFEKIVYSLYDAFDSLEKNIPEKQAQNITELKDLIQESTGIDPKYTDLLRQRR